MSDLDVVVHFNSDANKMVDEFLTATIIEGCTAQSRKHNGVDFEISDR